MLAFPGIFRGAFDVQSQSDINEEMKMAAAKALAELISDDELSAEYIIPKAFDKRVGTGGCEGGRRGGKKIRRGQNVRYVNFFGAESKRGSVPAFCGKDFPFWREHSRMMENNRKEGLRDAGHRSDAHDQSGYAGLSGDGHTEAGTGEYL